MQYIAEQKRWDGELEQRAFVDWFCGEVNAGNLDLVAESMLALERRHEPHLAAAMLELERRHPVLKEQSDGQIAHLPLSRLVEKVLPRSTPLVADLLIELGFYFRELNMVYRGMHFLRTLARHFEVKNDPCRLGKTWIRYGLIHRDLGDRERGLRCLWKAMILMYEALLVAPSHDARRDAELGLSDIQHQFGNLILGRDQNDIGILYYLRALSVREEYQDALRTGASLMNIGICYRDKGEHDRALHYLLRALLADQTILRFTSRAKTFQSLANLCDDTNELALSRKVFERAAEYDPAGDQSALLYAWVLIKLKEFEESLKHLDQFAHRRTFVAPRQRASALGLAAAVCDQLERPKDAEQFHTELVELVVNERIVMKLDDAKSVKLARARLESTAPGDHRTRAILHFAIGELDGSIAEIEKADTEDESDRQRILALKDHILASRPSESQDKEKAAENTTPVHTQTCRACRQPFARRDSGGIKNPAAKRGKVWNAAALGDKSTLTCPECATQITLQPQPLGRHADCPRCAFRFTLTLDGRTNGSPRSGGQTDLCDECNSALDMTDLVQIPGGRARLGDGATAEVAPFLMDRYPITNELFRIYSRVARLDWSPESWKNGLFDMADQPVTTISLEDCEKFCAWRSRLLNGNCRVPTLEQWLRAALGDDGRKYPWGNESPAPRHAAYSLFEDSDAVPAPVGMFPCGTSPFGVHDMAGNVWEWTSTMDDNGHVVYLGGSCGNESWQLAPHNQFHLLANPLKKDTRDGRLVGFRCVLDIK